MEDAYMFKEARDNKLFQDPAEVNYFKKKRLPEGNDQVILLATQIQASFRWKQRRHTVKMGKSFPSKEQWLEQSSERIKPFFKLRGRCDIACPPFKRKE